MVAVTVALGRRQQLSPLLGLLYGGDNSSLG